MGFNLGGGLAGAAGALNTQLLEQQKADLEAQRITLASSLAAERESRGRSEEAGYRESEASTAFDRTGLINTQQSQNRIAEDEARGAREVRTATETINAKSTPEALTRQRAITDATKEERPVVVPYGSSIADIHGKILHDGSPDVSSIDTGNPIVQSHVTNILGGNELMQNVPAPLRNAVSVALTQMPKASYSPTAASRFTLAASRIVQNYMKLPQYELTANGKPYLQRIDAAMKTPGSVSDQDLLDSLTKLNTAGNAVTDAQVRLITDGKSFADMASAFGNKFKNGGVLSDNQRQQIQTIAKAIYANYKKGYQPIYDQAVAQLKASGIPEAFWTIPDLNKLSEQGGLDDAGANEISAAPPQSRVTAPPAKQASGPSVGTVLNGYRYKGGDPHDQSSWEAVQ